MITTEQQKRANQIARAAGYGSATSIIYGDANKVVSHTPYGYRKKSTGEYVSNAYRNKFGWKKYLLPTCGNSSNDQKGAIKMNAKLTKTECQNARNRTRRTKHEKV